MDRLDRVLITEQELTPTSDFSLRVMDAVRAEGSCPPIPFPWLRFGIGFGVVPLLGMAAFAWLSSRLPMLPKLLEFAPDPRLFWLLATVLGSVGLLVWSRMLLEPQ